MTFQQYLVYSWVTGAIGTVVYGALGAIGVLVWRRVRRRRLASVPAVEIRSPIFAAPCPREGCRYTRGHLMPCWDGAPDPRRAERL